MTSIRLLYANRWVRYSLSLLLLALVILKVHPERVGAALSSASPVYLLEALALTLIFLAVKSLRWYLMLRAAGVDASVGEAATSLLGGMGLALVTPARLGELVRVAYLRDGQKWKIGGLVMLDKGFDVLVLAGLSIAGAWKLLGPLAGIAFVAATICGLAAVYWPVMVSAALHRLSGGLPWRTRLEAAWSSLDSLSRENTTTFIALTVLAFVVVLLQFGLILLSWRGWSFDVVFLTFPIVVLTNVLPVTIGGLGVREGAAALLLSHYGVSPADAALAAFLMFCINTALPGLVGALLLPPASPGAYARPARSLDGP